MISEYKDTFYIKATLLATMALLFILSPLTLKAIHFGGKDSISSAIHSNTLVPSKKISIKEMTAEQLTAFIDDAFDMDSIPLGMINEINMAIALLEQKAKKQFHENYQVDFISKKTAFIQMEKDNSIPTNMELKPLEKIVTFIQIDKLDTKQTNIVINNDNALPTDIPLKQTEVIELRFLVDKLEINQTIALENKPDLIGDIELLPIENYSITQNLELTQTLENKTFILPDTSGVLSIPSADYYVSWEINKLFPEKDMLKMKKDTSITLVLIDKAHKHYYHPFNGPITSQFGWRDSAQHNGIDIDLNRGDKVSAAFDGMVRVARKYGSFGNVVIIRHYNGLETVYAHLSKIKVKPGQLISSGDLVGLGGSTGHSTGTHLHFEVRFKGVPINPKYFISLSEQKLMCEEFTLKKTKWGLSAFPKNTKLYIVEKGDTVFEIAKRFGTTTASIKELNHLSGSRVRLKAGQQINVVR